MKVALIFVKPRIYQQQIMANQEVKSVKHVTCGIQPLPFNFIFMAFTSLSNWILHLVVWLEKY